MFRDITTQISMDIHNYDCWGNTRESPKAKVVFNYNILVSLYN